jgi:hypothetical protein
VSWALSLALPAACGPGTDEAPASDDFRISCGECIVTEPDLEPEPWPWLPPVDGPACNPRDVDWDWTIDDIYDFHVVGDASIQNIRLPYFGYEGPAAELNVGLDTDISREDGWALMFKDFGTAECPTSLPKFVLYNKYRGVIRLFYFNTLYDDSFSHAVGYLRQPNGGKAAALSTFGRPDYYLDSFDVGATEASVHKIAYLQWSFVDFPVIGYDPSLETDATLRFEIYGVQHATLQLDGEISLEQVLESGNAGGSLSLSGAVKLLSEGYSWYSGADAAKDKLAKYIAKHEDAWYEGIITDFLQGPAGMFGPYLAGISGLVNAFIASGKSAPTTPIKFSGELSLSGDFTLETLAHSFELRVPGAPLSNPDDAKRPFYEQPLGVFNVVSRPTLRYSMNMISCIGGGGDPGGGDEQCGRRYNYRLDAAPVFVFNPALADAVITPTVSYNFPGHQNYYVGPNQTTIKVQRFIGVAPSEHISVQVKVDPGDVEPVTLLNTYRVSHIYQPGF